MKEQTAKFLLEAGEAAGLDVKLYPDYSGRNMYGKQTWGITTENELKLLAAAIKFAYETGWGDGDSLTEGDAETAEEVDSLSETFDDLRNLRRDNMGRDVILY